MVKAIKRHSSLSRDFLGAGVIGTPAGLLIGLLPLAFDEPEESLRVERSGHEVVYSTYLRKNSSEKRNVPSTSSQVQKILSCDFNNQKSVNAGEERSWLKFKEQYSQPYEFGARGEEHLPVGRRTLAVQFENYERFMDGLTLYSSETPFVDRHGQAAASILDSTADRIAGVNVETDFINLPYARGWGRLDEVIFDYKNPDTQTLFSKADVISFSMGYEHWGDGEEQSSKGFLHTAKSIREADSFWQQSDAIFVWSAGNCGNNLQCNIERSDCELTIRADTLLKVGEAGHGSSGRHMVASHSSRSGVSVVALNPFTNGFSYPYVADEQSLRASLEQAFQLEMPTGGVSVLEDFYEAIDRRAETADQTFFEDAFTRIHPDFENADFPGKENLTKGLAWARENKEEVRKAFVECIVDSLHCYRKEKGVNDQGLVTGLLGTSFSAPYVAGMVAAMHERYPELSEYDLVAAALIAACPIEQVERVDKEAESLIYQDNGRGLRHNSFEAGFGLLEEGDYQQTVAEMASILATHPEMKTREMWVRSEMTEFSARGSHSVYLKNMNGFSQVEGYTIQIDKNVVALRTNLTLNFVGGMEAAPESIVLINPMGGSVLVAPTNTKRPLDPSNCFSCASTDGNCGVYGQGTWTIMTDVPLQSAQLTIAGMQEGGLVDYYINLNTPPELGF